jgi:hypothetical protein
VGAKADIGDRRRHIRRIALKLEGLAQFPLVLHESRQQSRKR